MKTVRKEKKNSAIYMKKREYSGLIEAWSEGYLSQIYFAFGWLSYIKIVSITWFHCVTKEEASYSIRPKFTDTCFRGYL